jgi:hypothetical protein
MIIEAKEEDLKKLGRRGFLRMFGATAASAVVAPTKTFVFFGDVLRPREQPVWTPPNNMVLTSEMLQLMVVGGFFGAMLLVGGGKKLISLQAPG